MRKHAGFTLIELMVVVAVVAIIAVVAIPAYTGQVRKSHRADAVNGLGDLQLRQERWRAENPAFADTTQLGAMPASPYYIFAATTPTGTCADGTTACTSSNCYAVTADTTGTQTGDDDQCATLTLASRCGRLERTSTPAGGRCWDQ
jgi:type IV pilus assembly protein PilE